MSLSEKIDNLESAYQARDAAEERAIAYVYRQFAGYIARLQQEYQDEIRREASDDEMDD